MDAVLWGHRTEALKRLDSLFAAWHKSRGSDTSIGKRPPAILPEAGFINTIKCVSVDTKDNSAAVHSHSEITVSLLDGPFGRDLLNQGLADNATVEHLKKSIRAWVLHPDASFANIHVEVLGHKPG